MSNISKVEYAFLYPPPHTFTQSCCIILDFGFFMLQYILEYFHITVLGTPSFCRTIWTCHNLFIRSTTNAHSGSFHISTTINNAAINNIVMGYFIHISVQFSRSVVSDSATPWTAVYQASLSITNSPGLFKLMSKESVMPSNHLIPCCPLLLLPSIFPRIRVFSNESVLHIRWSPSLFRG